MPSDQLHMLDFVVILRILRKSPRPATERGSKRERERERRDTYMYAYIYVYIYTHIAVRGSFNGDIGLL